MWGVVCIEIREYLALKVEISLKISWYKELGMRNIVRTRRDLDVKILDGWYRGD